MSSAPIAVPGPLPSSVESAHVDSPGGRRAPPYEDLPLVPLSAVSAELIERVETGRDEDGSARATLSALKRLRTSMAAQGTQMLDLLSGLAMAGGAGGTDGAGSRPASPGTPYPVSRAVQDAFDSLADAETCLAYALLVAHGHQVGTAPLPADADDLLVATPLDAAPAAKRA